MNATDIINKYNLTRHPEGGWFAEMFQSEEISACSNIRGCGGSIYFLLNTLDISHFHKIDCEEIWFYHQGCGLEIFIITDNGALNVKKLGQSSIDTDPMVVIHRGTIFAARNLNVDDFTFVSCVTMPKFTYEGFEIIDREKLISKFPHLQSLNQALFLK